MVAPSDAELVRRTRSGDKEAYGELVTRYQGHVYGLAYSIVNHWADAQDIAQEAFIRAYCNLNQLRDPARFAAWLRRVTFSVAMNWLKAFRPGLFEQLGSPEDIDRLNVPDFAPGPAEITEKRELAEAVLRAVTSLPPKYRIPLTMFHLDGLSYQKVADFLDIPIGTAKSLIYRAREKLRPALSAYAMEEVSSMVQEVFDEQKLPAEFVRKVLEGVEKLQWGKGQENTFIGALTAAMRAIGEDVTYDYLMGVSGAAFRLHFHQPGWCPSSPDATCGFNHAEPAMKALGYIVEGHWTPEDKPEAVKKTREAIVESINKGFPVVAIDLINGAPDYGVIVGYSDGGKKFLCRTYEDKTEGYSQAEKWPWVVLVIKEKGKVPDRRENLLRSLEIAVELANTDRYPGHAEKTFYASGFGAYETWAANLLDESRFEKLDEKELNRLTHTNGWCYLSLVDAREAAVRYLKSLEGEFDRESATHLSKAAGLYEEIVEKLKDGWKYAPMPWQLKEGEHWTKEMRHAEAGVLKEALSLERTAVDELKQYYDMIGLSINR